MQAERRAAMLFAALSLYGAASAPAPPEVGGVEAVIGLLLIAAVGIRRPIAVAAGQPLGASGTVRWEAVGVMALLYLLWLPMLRGAWLGWEARDVVRDVVPLLYLFLPVLLVPLLRDAADGAVRLLSGGLMVAGVAFAVRWWVEMRWGFGAVGQRFMGDGPFYFLNSPSVLYAALGLPVSALDLIRAGGLRRWGLALLLLAGAALCLGALAGAVHRMALGLAVLAYGAIVAWWGRRAPWLLGAAVLAALLALGLFGDAIVGTVGQIGEKSRLVGGNARIAEALAALDRVGRSLPSLLLGDGWGALFENPSVGGWRVSYTHTLATYFLVKAGMAGVAALLAYLALLLPLAFKLLRDDMPRACAVLPPLAVALGMHTSFKYLCCGVLLSLMVLMAERCAPRDVS